MRIFNQELIFSSTDLSIASTSQPIWLGHIVNYSIQLVYSGTPAGNFQIQASNDLGSSDLHIPDPIIVNWSNIGSAIAVSSAGSVMVNLENSGYRWARLTWTPTASDPGDLDSARYNLKGI